jgi:hypothetical protein
VSTFVEMSCFHSCKHSDYGVPGYNAISFELHSQHTRGSLSLYSLLFQGLCSVLHSGGKNEF